MILQYDTIVTLALQCNHRIKNIYNFNKTKIEALELSTVEHTSTQETWYHCLQLVHSIMHSPISGILQLQNTGILLGWGASLFCRLGIGRESLFWHSPTQVDTGLRGLCSFEGTIPTPGEPSLSVFETLYPHVIQIGHHCYIVWVDEDGIYLGFSLHKGSHREQLASQGHWCGAGPPPVTNIPL